MRGARLGPCAGHPGFLGVFSLRADSASVRLFATGLAVPRLLLMLK